MPNASYQPRKPREVERSAVAAPGDVDVRPQQEEVYPVDIARDGVGDVEHVEWPAQRFDGVSEPGGICV